MGKYSAYTTRQEPVSRKRELHPIWRGVGFVLIILIPILAWFGQEVLFNLNMQHNWLRITQDMLSPNIPFLGIGPYLYIKLVLLVSLMFILYALFLLITFIIYPIIAPPRYGPYDMPPVQYKGKQYKR